MQRKTLSFFLAAALVAAALLPFPAAAGVLTNNCVVGDRPAATLLFPYFEVDLANPSGRTTLISINNRDTFIFPVLARVTIWTDWGIPTTAFTLFLQPNDVQTLNLRDLFNTGLSPITGPNADLYSGCDGTLGGSVGAPVLLQAAHTGQNSFGSCFSSGRLGPNIATGYVTVDHALRCRDAAGLGSDTPVDADYFAGATPLAGTDNVLWGDWMIVTPDEAFASGNPAVHIQADPDFFGAGEFTFYGRYHSFDGSDKRRPLPSAYDARFLNGGAFTGGTKLIVWRDTRSADTGVVSCGSTPSWFPLGERQIKARDETAAFTDLGATTIFDLATQRMDITDIPQPYTFGFLEMNLNLTDNTTAQAWVGVEASAAGQYSVGFPAVPTNDLCSLAP